MPPSQAINTTVALTGVRSAEAKGRVFDD